MADPFALRIVRAMGIDPVQLDAQFRQFFADAREVRDGFRGAKSGFQEAMAFYNMRLDRIENALKLLGAAEYLFENPKPNGEDHTSVEALGEGE